MTEQAWTDADEMWMRMAIELSHHCPPAEGAFSVGAVIVDSDGNEVARGYSREGGDPHVHAEAAALAKVESPERLQGGTIYSSLEPCSQRRQPVPTCTQRILESGLARVVIAWREPSLFVDDCQGFEMLCAAGLTVVEIPLLASGAREANAHLRGISS
ncbi:deaminase [Streptomyces sp. NPDC048389]|uniref:deaminase n=1 Tax=Streptomyces sp. NPDC048389 TaxID=3154622 RepID=UPI00345442A4